MNKDCTEEREISSLAKCNDLYQQRNTRAEQGKTCKYLSAEESGGT
jgi:hypothetical protein